MKNKSLYAALCGLTISATCHANLKIWHGDKVLNNNIFPAVVAIYNDQDDTTNSTCTGTVIAKQWVLTASHCVLDQKGQPAKASDLSIGTGILAGSKQGAIAKIPADHFVTYAPSGFDLDHDVALIHLSYETGIAPIKLANAAASNPLKQQGSDAINVGFGFREITSWGDSCKSDPYGDDCTFEVDDNTNLLQGPQKILSDADAVKMYNQYKPPIEVPYQYNSKTMLAAYSPSGQHGSNGDSGGPLFIHDAQNTLIEVGINSWGFPPFYPSVIDGSYAKEPMFLVDLSNSDIHQFIDKTIQQP